MDADSRQLIVQLREEAGELKECFTRFSFQAMAFTAVVFGLLARSDISNVFVPLACLVLVTMLLAVARIGCYKYHGSNIAYGYQLHLERVARLGSTENGWKEEMVSVGWEEVKRAWRVVEPTIFRHLYYWHALLPNRLRAARRKESEPSERWFEPETLVRHAKTGATYHAGRYLRLMLSMLYGLALFSTFPVWQYSHQLVQKVEGGVAELLYLGPLGLVALIFYRVWIDLSIVGILERGLHSIHSCAVLWQAVVVAHFRALEKTSEGAGRGYENYTWNLAFEAESLKEKIFAIDSWVGLK